MTNLVGLLGSPVTDSPSPAIHQAAFAALGLDWDYRAFEVPRGELRVRWPDLTSSLAGANVTAPHKEEVRRLVDRVTPAAAVAGSVNTVLFSAEGSLGATTDGQGFLAALRGERSPVPRRALVLGTGGAARAVVAALLSTRCQVTVAGRNQAAGMRIAADLRSARMGPVELIGLELVRLSRVLEEVDLLVNATTVGSSVTEAQCPLPEGVSLPADMVVFDLVYRPRETRLLALARRSGCRCISGLEMLVEQAALSFQMWTGLAAPLAVMRAAAGLPVRVDPGMTR